MEIKPSSKCIEIIKEFRFEAAHYLPDVPDGHKCGRLHGHSFRLEVVLSGDIDTTSGWLVDFGDISKAVKPLLDKHLDHRYLNEIPGLENPTSETIAVWLWNKLKPQLQYMSRIIVHETPDNRCEYSG